MAFPCCSFVLLNFDEHENYQFHCARLFREGKKCFRKMEVTGCLSVRLFEDRTALESDKGKERKKASRPFFMLCFYLWISFSY